MKCFVGRVGVILMMIALLILPGAVASAEPEGPGYGGGADNLSVAWTDTAATRVLAGAPRGASAPGVPTDSPVKMADPEILSAASSRAELSVFGLGFGNRSEVDVRVGDGDNMTARTDSTGTLEINLSGGDLTQAQPGVSVLALGRSPSGSMRTLVGAVPPEPDGVGPSELLPWLVGGLLVAVAGFWAIRRRR